MPSIFTLIMQRELPGRFVYEDEHVAAFLTIEPLRPGHTLVVPRLETEHWIDLPPDEQGWLWAASAKVATAIQAAYQPRRIAALVLGLEVPHVHVHLVPIDSESEIDFRRVDRSPEPADLDAAAERIRAAFDPR